MRSTLAVSLSRVCGRSSRRCPLIAGQQPRAPSTTPRCARPAAGDEWLTYGLDQAETRFSPLTDINAVERRAAGPGVGVRRRARGGGGQEATPLVWNGTIYGITNWSVVFAVDARTGKEKWRWDPWVNKTEVRPEICCGVVNRGLALYQGLVYVPVIDGRLQALDADTGKVVWESRVAFPQDHYTLTMAPRIAKGKVIIGASGGDRPTRGFFDAYDAITGRRAWRFYTVPGDPAKPAENAAMKKAVATWDKEWWKNGGGGAVWDGAAYDPELESRLRRHRQRRAVDAGAAHVDGHGQSLRLLHPRRGRRHRRAEVALPGGARRLLGLRQRAAPDPRRPAASTAATRKVIMQANKNGFFYVIDRVTGQFISAAAVLAGHLGQRPRPEDGPPDGEPGGALRHRRPSLVTPGGGGAHNWSPMAFNPMTGLTYVPTSTLNTFSYAAEQPFNPRPGSMTGTVRPAPAPTAPAPPAIGPTPLEGTGDARRAGGVGSGGAARCSGACRAAAASAAAR